MAGNCRPTGITREAKITIEELLIHQKNIPIYDKDNLVSGEFTRSHYQNAVLIDSCYGTDYFVFSIIKKCNVWGVSGFYRDDGGETNRPVKLYKKVGESYSLVGTYETSNGSNGRGYDEWYKLFDNLEPGCYKVEATGRYSAFQELYGENLEPELELYVRGKTMEVFGMSNKMFTKLSDNWSALTDEEKKALFESTNYDTASVEDLATLGKFKVLNYSETNDKPELTVSAVPKDKIIFSRGFLNVEDIEGIDKATLTKTLFGSGICKLLVTDDMKKYYAYDFDTKTWKVVDHTTVATVKTSGIDAAKFADIDRAAWDKLLKGKSGVGFAYLMAIEAVADQCAMDKLALQVDKKGKWA